MDAIPLGFVPKPLLLAVDVLLPSKKLGSKALASDKYQQIRASIEEIGLIEPLSVTAVDRESGHHMVLDGHVRLHALKELGQSEVACLVSTSIEAFTYNKHVNRLSTVQEHLMIRRALDRGISIAKLSRALYLDANLLKKKGALLDGISPEVTALLQDRTFSASITPLLRRMKPARQIECAELMVAANRVTVAYARCLLAGTPAEMLVEGEKPLRPAAASKPQKARMEREMANLSKQYKLAERSFGEDVLNLMLARGYVGKLLANAKIKKYVRQHYPEVVEELSRIAAMESVDA